MTPGAQLRNYWQVDVTLGKSWNTWDDKLTRGGPTTIRPGIESLSVVVTSDARRRFWVTRRPQLSNREFGSRSRQYCGHAQPPAVDGAHPVGDAHVTSAPTPSPSTSRPCPTRPPPPTFGSRYVFGGLDQTEWSIPLRVNLVLSPRLSLQLYTQALLSTGDYPPIRSSPRRAPTTSRSTGWTSARSRGTPSGPST